MIELYNMTIDHGKRKIDSPSLKVDTSDGDEDANRLFNLIAEVYRKVLEGPRISFDMKHNPPRVSEFDGENWIPR